ncbi:hypothetical protein OSB04_019844 [Centaurea solstitialis]|uniref:Myb/SANT-like domain-containing protein n=1 Tax=Centaurea solstitialis TaxID=347529 RepID=A0AA38T2K1_9ASTR|nr:hypothetical protein OSB04_019844 [Centaurea solstitialis]
MKNQFDYLRGKYVVWSRLVNKTGNLYNPTTNTFNLTEEEWQAEAKLSKFADKLRNPPPLLYPQLCKQGSWSNLPNPSRAPNVSNPHLLVDDESLHTTQVPPVSDEAPPMSNQAHVVTHMQAIFDKPSEDDDVGACIAKLDKLGWEDTSLYEATLFLFSKGANYRKIWLCLKDEKCKSWTEFTARQLKLM